MKQGSYCPHCGKWDTHKLLVDTSNGLGWRVIQLECTACEMYWEMWVFK